jgi:hypothetical protein
MNWLRPSRTSKGWSNNGEEAHLANQRDERALAALKSELRQIQASYDQIHKANQAKLALLEHNIAALRALGIRRWRRKSARRSDLRNGWRR